MPFRRRQRVPDILCPQRLVIRIKEIHCSFPAVKLWLVVSVGTGTNSSGAQSFVISASTTGSRHRRNRFYDEKGNRVSVSRFHEFLLAACLKGTQALTDKPYLPWVPFPVIRRLKGILDKNSSVLEYGSGRSTIWLARQSKSVTSIESYLPWFERVSSLFTDLGLDVDYRFRSEQDYSSAAGFADESFDLIVVDGIQRSKCIENVHTKLKHGGYLYLDNSDTDTAAPGGDMRLAEAKMKQLSDIWSSPIEFYTGFSPGNLHVHQGALLRKP
jgi:hypothetical protein